MKVRHTALLIIASLIMSLPLSGCHDVGEPGLSSSALADSEGGQGADGRVVQDIGSQGDTTSSGADASGLPDAAADDTVSSADAPTPAPEVTSTDTGEPGDVALPPVCPPGLLGCADGQRITCSEDGSAFELTPCDAGLVCLAGVCVACITAEQCSAEEVCAGNECSLAPLEVITAALPTALLGVPLSTELLARNK